MEWFRKKRPGTGGAAAILQPQIPPALWLHVGPDTPRLTRTNLFSPRPKQYNGYAADRDPRECVIFFKVAKHAAIFTDSVRYLLDLHSRE
jgi:hypothetical protein